MIFWALAWMMGCSDDGSRGVADGGDSDADADGGPDSGGDTDTDSPLCELGEYQGDFTVSTPADLEEIAGYNFIDGNLLIGCPECESLAALACLEAVLGDLRIGYDNSTTVFGNDLLESLDGLQWITHVGGDLAIFHNPLLGDVDELSGITGTVESVEVSFDDLLTEVDGLSGIEGEVVDLVFFENPLLLDVNGVQGITSVSENLHFEYNESLESVVGLASIEHVGTRLAIADAQALSSLDGLQNITGVLSELWLYNTDVPYCQICDFLAQLDEDPVPMYVHDNQNDSCWGVGGLLCP